jgi:hypothetical protein
MNKYTIYLVVGKFDSPSFFSYKSYHIPSVNDYIHVKLKNDAQTYRVTDRLFTSDEFGTDAVLFVKEVK